MALDALDILDTLGIEKESVTDPNSVYEKYVTELSKAVVTLFKNNFQAVGLYQGSAILQSIISIPDGALGFEIQADDYYKFIDEGVDGTQQSQGSQYKFKTDTPSPDHVKNIQQWIPKRNLFLPPEIPTFNSFAYAIATAVKRRGIAPKHITDKTMTDEALQQITDDINTLTGLMVNFIFLKNTE